MIGRRGFLTAVAALTAGFPAELTFEVLRNGAKVGHHSIAFRQDGETIEAAIAVNIAVGLGPIVLYRYTHTGREIWRAGNFLSLRTETNDDGRPFRVAATRTADNVIVETAGAARAVFPADAIPLTHWNDLCMRRPLFNPQDGVAIASRVVAHGTDTVSLTGGSRVPAVHYSLVGKVALDDWYDMTHLWTALRTLGTDGSAIEYRRLG